VTSSFAQSRVSPPVIFALGIVLAFAVGFQSGSKSKTIIRTDKAPKAIGPYSQGILIGDMLFVSGQLGIDPATGKLAGDSLEVQVRQVMKNIGGILNAGGFDFQDVVQSTVFLKDLNEFARVNAIYAEFFPSDPPTRATVEVSRLPMSALVEVAVVAVKGGK
jgi:2-iminobutanoate/2-iminopropanoate deaminase